MDTVMPNYYNPYSMTYPMNYNSGMYSPMQQATQPLQYMTNVDGEAAAKSWQPPFTPQPNTIIPLFDLDGQHVYFKSYDGYGRMNPLRKGQIVFDSEPQASGEVAPVADVKPYATKEDIDGIRQEIQGLNELLQNRNVPNQNGSNFRGEKR